MLVWRFGLESSRYEPTGSLSYPRCLSGASKQLQRASDKPIMFHTRCKNKRKHVLAYTFCIVLLPNAIVQRIAMGKRLPYCALIVLAGALQSTDTKALMQKTKNQHCSFGCRLNTEREMHIHIYIITVSFMLSNLGSYDWIIFHKWRCHALSRLAAHLSRYHRGRTAGPEPAPAFRGKVVSDQRLVDR